tara:strand:- start:3829 stop:6018 length:2190 start_codon:yes stop_codon:yes gene_type:complete
MLKLTYRIFIILLILIITGLFYLSYFGLTTNKFNNVIEKKINKIFTNKDIKIQEIKILLNLFQLSVNLQTKNTIINVGNEDIELKKIVTNLDLKSYINKNFALKNLYFDFKKNNVKKIIGLLRAYDDNVELFLLNKFLEDGNIASLSGKIYFKENGKIDNDKFEILSEIDSFSFKPLNKNKIKNLSAQIRYSNKIFEITKIKFNYLNINLISDSIFVEDKNNNFFIKGHLKNINDKIPKEILSKFLKINNFKNIDLSSDNIFEFNISKKLKISNFKIKSNINLKEAELIIDNKNIKKYLPEIKKNIKLSNHSLVIKHENKISFIDGSGKFIINDKEDKISYKLETNDKKIKYNLKINLLETFLKINLINFSKKKGNQSLLIIDGEKNKELNKISKIYLKSDNDEILINNIEISKNNKISKFEKIKIKFLDENKNQNDLLIKKYKKNSYKIYGDYFNLSKIIDNMLFSKDSEKINIFDNKLRFFNLSFKKNPVDDKNHILNLKGDFKIKNNQVVNMTLSSYFPNGKNVSLTVRSKNNKKVTTFNSEFAEPFVKKYKFIKSFEEGKLDFYSVKENKTSNSQIKIYDFRIKELPALTKILTLASLQGIADILSGDGVGFDEFEMNFVNEEKLMKIQEVYAIGPALSILIDGYVENDELISLRGTLVPATTINKFIGSIPILGDILVGKKTGEGVFGVSFKIKGSPKELKTTVNPIKTLTPRFITRTLEKIKK